MKCKTAYLVINPRVGKNIAKLTDVIAVLSAAGWKTDVAVKEFGGHTMELATRGAEEGYDLVIGYGGDGTLNQVINGVVTVKGQDSIVGVIPGGTANVWASEVGVPVDPVKASLSLLGSKGRRVDLGHVKVESLTILPTPHAAGEPHPAKGSKRQDGRTTKSDKRRVKTVPGGRNHFLLMAGLGIDAAIMSQVPTPLKEAIGEAAVAVTAVKEMGSHHRFPIEIRSSGRGRAGEVRWKGEALQVIVGNTRRYGNIAEVTPDAYIDDGVLDVCVVTAGSPLTTMQQIVSFVLQRKPSKVSAERFHGAHLSITVPASIDLQLDGSAVKLKDYLRKADWRALQKADDAKCVMVEYQFDARPRALQMAIPFSYADSLFKEGTDKAKARVVDQRQRDDKTLEQKAVVAALDFSDRRSAEERQHDQVDIAALLTHGRRVRVVGTSRIPGRKAAYIVAGTIPKDGTRQAKPVAVCIDSRTRMVAHTGEPLARTAVKELQDGTGIVVEGKQSKRGVIRAKRVVIL